MAKSLSYAHTDTAISGVTTNPIELGLVNFGADWRVESEGPNQIVLTNITSPLGIPEKFSIFFRVVQDVYKNTNIDPAYRSPSTRAVQIYFSHTDFMQKTDSVDATFLQYIPIRSSGMFEVSADELMTGTLAEAALRRGLAAWYNTGTHTIARMTALLRGCLDFPDM